MTIFRGPFLGRIGDFTRLCRLGKVYFTRWVSLVGFMSAARS
jgi:hypothetical protein